MVCDRKWQRDSISSEDASALLLILSNAVLDGAGDLVWAWQRGDVDPSALSSLGTRGGEGRSGNSLATHLPSRRRRSKGVSRLCSG